MAASILNFRSDAVSIKNTEKSAAEQRGTRQTCQMKQTSRGGEGGSSRSCGPSEKELQHLRRANQSQEPSEALSSAAFCPMMVRSCRGVSAFIVIVIQNVSCCEGATLCTLLSSYWLTIKPQFTPKASASPQPNQSLNPLTPVDTF